eukprot:3450519-Rhodomonas_salina.2
MECWDQHRCRYRTFGRGNIALLAGHSVRNGTPGLALKDESQGYPLKMTREFIETRIPRGGEKSGVQLTLHRVTEAGATPPQVPGYGYPGAGTQVDLLPAGLALRPGKPAFAIPRYPRVQILAIERPLGSS